MGAAMAASSGAWSALLAVESLLESGETERARSAMRWFDAIEETGEVTTDQGACARTLRTRIEGRR
jgi:hypothetical protein